MRQTFGTDNAEYFQSKSSPATACFAWSAKLQRLRIKTLVFTSILFLTASEYCNPPLQLSLLIGDLSYADAGNKPSKERPCSQDRWDSWGNIIEPLMSTQTVVPLPGNHEVEKSGLAEHPDFIAYQARGGGRRRAEAQHQRIFVFAILMSVFLPHKNIFGVKDEAIIVSLFPNNLENKLFRHLIFCHGRCVLPAIRPPSYTQANRAASARRRTRAAAKPISTLPSARPPRTSLHSRRIRISVPARGSTR
jgi:hypothetical protein